MTICLVTDRRQLSPDARTTREDVLALGRFLEGAVAAGVDLIQLREPDLSTAALSQLARAVRTAADGSGTRVVVNDRADVALACDCDGVHLRGNGPPVSRVRELARGSIAQAEGRDPRHFLTGRSVHTVDEAQTHAAADYLLFGAVFDSGPKPGIGLAALRAAVHISRATSPAVIAIGGITVPRAIECITAGASGVAAIRLFLPPGRAEGALGVSEAVVQLRGAFDDAVTGHLQ
ncbi:MAG: thiamine phosphate synthase [Vicinamibacterales bacterium]